MLATNRGKDGAPTQRVRRQRRKFHPSSSAVARPWSLPIRRSARRVYGSITLAESWLSTSKSTIFQAGFAFLRWIRDDAQVSPVTIGVWANVTGMRMYS